MLAMAENMLAGTRIKSAARNSLGQFNMVTGRWINTAPGTSDAVLDESGTAVAKEKADAEGRGKPKELIRNG